MVRTRLVCPVFHLSKEKSSILLLNTGFSANFLTDSLRSKHLILFNISFEAVKESKIVKKHTFLCAFECMVGALANLVRNKRQYL